MKYKSSLFVFSLAYFFLAGKSFPQRNYGTVFQSAPIISLMGGVMNDNFSVSKMKKMGDFGLGTFNGVDGEMIYLNGVVYRVNSEGIVNIPANSEKVPFVTELFFRADTVIDLNDTLNYSGLDNFIDEALPSKNAIFAVKVIGKFISIQARSEEKQSKPYSSLSDVLKHQTIFNFKNIEGTMVGFRFPLYMNELNAPGYHFHFLSENKNHGGHVLNLMTKHVKIEIEFVKNFKMRIPSSTDFKKNNFEGSKQN
ncbi:MAG: acetolactate decarboxylase [Ignavibacteriaceae bacterium]